MYLPEYVGWLSTNCGQGKKVSQLWMPFWSFGVSMKTKHNFIIWGFNIRIFDLFKINSSCLCVLYLISLMAQAYVTVVFIFNSLPHCKHKLETCLNYYFKVILNVGALFLRGFKHILVFHLTKCISSIISVLNMVCSKRIFFFSHSYWISNMKKSSVWLITFAYKNKCKANLEYYVSSIGFLDFF